VMDHATTAEIHGGVYGLPVNFRIGRDRSIARKYPGVRSTLRLLEARSTSSLATANELKKSFLPEESRA